VEAAARVFEEQGYVDTTTNHIAERAGVSIGSLYQYFPNKEAILAVLLEEHFDEGVEALEAIQRHLAEVPHDLVGMTRHYVDGIIELHAKNPRLHHVLQDEAPRPPHLVERLRVVEAAAVDATEVALRESPEVQVQDYSTAAYLLVQTIETLVHKFIVEPRDQVSRERFADELVRMLVRYLRGDVSSDQASTTGEP
jgi:AcrR family transcriptional regulator